MLNKELLLMGSNNHEVVTFTIFKDRDGVSFAIDIYYGGETHRLELNYAGTSKSLVLPYVSEDARIYEVSGAIHDTNFPPDVTITPGSDALYLTGIKPNDELEFYY